MLLYAITAPVPADLRSMRDVKGYASVSGNDSEGAFTHANRALPSVRGYATQSTDAGDCASQREAGYPHILISFAYDHDRSFFRSKLGYDPPDWLGDSGAFTAWTLGERIDLGELIEWCRYHVEVKPSFQCISLDVIPGQPGGNREPTKRERSKAMRESLDNGDAMRASGLKIMEVFHVFEPLDHLELLLDRRQEGELVGLGGMVGRGEALKRQFADEVFRFVGERTGSWQGIPPLHGLGISIRSPIAARYPWWSVDSSSWIAPAQYGKKVTRYGTLKGDDHRTSHRSVRHLYLVRALEGWLKQEQALTKMWLDRGVTYAP